MLKCYSVTLHMINNLRNLSCWDVQNLCWEDKLSWNFKDSGMVWTELFNNSKWTPEVDTQPIKLKQTTNWHSLIAYLENFRFKERPCVCLA